MNVTNVGSALLVLRQSPLVLRAFFGFCVVASILSMSGFYSVRLNQALIPYVGWGGLGVYMFATIFVVGAIFSPVRRAIYGAALELVVGACGSLIQALPHFFGGATAQNDFGNPYLMYNPLNPLFTVVMPLLWAILLFSPTMRHWVKQKDRGL